MLTFALATQLRHYIATRLSDDDIMHGTGRLKGLKLLIGYIREANYFPSSLESSSLGGI